MLDQLRAYQINKFQIQAEVNHGCETLFDAVPHAIDAYPSRADLEPRGHPDDEHANVDDADCAYYCPLQLSNSSFVVHDQGNAVDDNEHETLDLVVFLRISAYSWPSGLGSIPGRRRRKKHTCITHRQTVVAYTRLGK